jgi:hypothetical protein
MRGLRKTEFQAAEAAADAGWTAQGAGHASDRSAYRRERRTKNDPQFLLARAPPRRAGLITAAVDSRRWPPLCGAELPQPDLKRNG